MFALLRLARGEMLAFGNEDGMGVSQFITTGQPSLSVPGAQHEGMSSAQSKSLQACAAHFAKAACAARAWLGLMQRAAFLQSTRRAMRRERTGCPTLRCTPSSADVRSMRCLVLTQCTVAGQQQAAQA
eukprot:351080-Rhodomonas_salina.2